MADLPPTQSWATRLPADSKWSLEAISSGCSRGTLPLHELYEDLPLARHLLIGRDEDQCPIVVSSQLSSRIHAVLAFKNLSNNNHNPQLMPYLLDNNSSHGTYLNFKPDSKLPSKAYVEVYDGDIIQFGKDEEKKKFYIIKGPIARSDVLNKQRNVMKVETSASKTKEQIEMLKKQANAQRAANPDAEPEAPELTKSQLKLRNEIATKNAKMANLELEMERIEQKEELSAGQEKTLEKNQAAVGRLRDEITILEERMGNSTHKSAEQRKKEKREEDEAIEDSEFYDKTQEKKEKSVLDSGEALGLKELKELKAALMEKTKGEEQAEMKAGRRLAANAVKEDDDELDAYEKELKRGEVEKELLGIRKKKGEIQEEMGRCEGLMDMIDKEWREKEKVEKELVEAAEAAEVAKAAAKAAAKEAATKEVVVESMAPPAKKRTFEEMAPPPSMAPPPPKKVAMAPPPPTLVAMAPPPPKKVAGPKGPVKGPAAPPPAKAPAPRAKAPAAESEEQESVWTVPENQDGSGRTKLNDKFAGRY